VSGVVVVLVEMLVAVTPVLATRVGACVCGLVAVLLDGEHAPATVAVKAAKTRSDRRTPQAYYECALSEIGWARSMTKCKFLEEMGIRLVISAKKKATHFCVAHFHSKAPTGFASYADLV